VRIINELRLPDLSTADALPEVGSLGEESLGGAVPGSANTASGHDATTIQQGEDNF